MKKLIALLLSVLVAASIVLGGGAFLWYQPAAAIVDRTMETAESAVPGTAAQNETAQSDAVMALAGQPGGDGGGAEPNTGTLNPNVRAFIGEDATAVYSSVQATAFNGEGQLEMTLASGSAFAELDAGEIFFLDGDETTLFGGAYIGKVAKKNTDSSGNTVVTVENATMDEAFDALNVEIDSTLSQDNLISMEAVDGVDLQFTEDAAATYASLPGGSGLPEPVPLTQEQLDKATSRNSLQDSLAVVETAAAEKEAAENETGDTTQTDVHGKSPKTEAEPLSTGQTPPTPVPQLPAATSTPLALPPAATSTPLALPPASTATPAPTATPLYLPTPTPTPLMLPPGSTPTPTPTAKPSLGEAVTTDVDVSDEGLVATLQVDMVKAFGIVTNDALSTDALDDVLDVDNSCTLTGKLSVTNISCDLNSDWSIDYLVDSPTTLGFKDLSMAYTADVDFDTVLDGKLAMELKDDNSSFSIGNWFKMEGLPYKKFPIICAKFSVGAPIRIAQYPKGDAKITDLGSIIPEVMLVVFVDMDGNISVTYNMSYNFSCDFDDEYVVVQDFEYVLANKNGGKPDISQTFKMSFSFETDMDIHTGIALDVFFCGVSILDLNLLKVGAQLQGTGGFEMTSTSEGSTDGQMSTTSSVDLDLYTRVYLQVVDLHVMMRATLSFLDKKILSAGFDEFVWTLFDLDLFTGGVVLDTYYDENTMSVGSRTAEDSEAIYFVTETGEIGKQSKSTQFYSTLSESDSITRFVAIDDSYLYYIRPGDDAYDLCRVSKESGIIRVLKGGVANVLGQDAKRLFYLSSSDKSVIRALDRGTYLDKAFSSFDDDVELMTSYEDRYYVLTVHSDLFSFLFGADLHYYLLDQNGNQVQDLGENPEPANLPRWGDHFTERLTSNGQLRAIAEAVYWVPGGGGDAIEVEGVSGWAVFGKDIAVTQNAPEGSALPYMIRRYSGANGSVSDVIPVRSDQAFFTLCQDKDGYWYYFDEDTEAGEMYLYRLDSNLSNQTLLQTYSSADFGVSLESCGMEQIGGKLIFYSITGDDSSASGQTLLRYDIY